jgi:hypothetical protein
MFGAADEGTPGETCETPGDGDEALESPGASEEKKTLYAGIAAMRASTTAKTAFRQK